MITLTSTDPTPDLLPLQTHFPLIGYPEGRQDIDGKGVTVVMIGNGWNLNHEAIGHNPNIGAPPTVSWPVTEHDHDTAVLGILGAVYGGTGIRGMCPSATIRPVYYGTLRDTLLAAQSILQPGGVILMERVSPSSTAETPSELSDDVFDAVKGCTDAGIIVVQPAGNTNTDLDEIRFMEKFRKESRDSGAIFMAAAYTKGGYVGPTGFSNYGSRIDLCAPGVDILSAGYGTWVGGENENRWYGKVKGTSYAGAIVAGACACVNSARIAAGRPPLGALDMRSLLVTTSAETDQSSWRPGIQIGRMLNMRKALATAAPASADFDGDGKVGMKDFLAFCSAWGGTDARFDLDGDGKVGLPDFWIFTAAFGKGTG